MKDPVLEETRILYPGKLKWSLVSLAGLVFSIGGVFKILDKGDAMSWFGELFFVAVALFGLMQLFGKGSSLELNGEGFQVRHFGRALKPVRWQDCSDFGVASVNSNKMIVYDQLQEQEKAMGRVGQSLLGGSSSLPDTYGMKPQKLADLMNAYREKSFYNDLN